MKPKVIVVDAYGTVLDITSYNGQDCEDRFFQRHGFEEILEALRKNCTKDARVVCVSCEPRKDAARVMRDMREAGVDVSRFDKMYRFDGKPDFERIARDYKVKPSRIEFVAHLWNGWRNSFLEALHARVCISIPWYIQIDWDAL